MEKNWQAELNNNINTHGRWQKIFSKNKLTHINSIVVILLMVLSIPAIIGGIYDQRSRAAENSTENTLGMNLNVPVCSNSITKACGYTSECDKYLEGATCERLQACTNGRSANDIFICKKGKWVYSKWTNNGACNLCGEKKNANSPTPSLAAPTTSIISNILSPTVIPNTNNNNTSATTNSSFLMGSNLGAWGIDNKGAINEPFLTNTSQRNLAKGVITFMRFPARSFTDAQVIQIADSIKSLGIEPLVIVSASNAQSAIHLAGILKGHVTYFEFGNEDNYFKGWSGSTYAANYLQAIPQMKAVNPSIKIGGPVVSHIAANGSQYIRDFLTAIKSNPAAYPDFISGHIYVEHGENTSNAQVLQQAATWGSRIAVVKNDSKTILGKSLPIAITEWNWDAQPENSKNPDTRDTDPQFMHDFVFTVLDQFRSQGVWAANIYDFGAGAGGQHLDIVSTAGTAKPEYDALKAYKVANGL